MVYKCWRKRKTHSTVCVCEIHQNVKLLIAVTPGVEGYEEVMTAMVCDIKRKECIIYRCSKCPGSTAFTDYVMTKFKQADMFEEDVITFKQWTHLEKGCTLITWMESVASHKCCCHHVRHL